MAGWSNCALVVVVCSACGDDVDDGVVTLTNAITGLNTRVTGAGLDCGTLPPCDGSATATTCSVELARGTLVQLHVTHPVCPPGGTYFTFAFAEPCERTGNFDCEFVITEDTVVSGQGVIAARAH